MVSLVDCGCWVRAGGRDLLFEEEEWGAGERLGGIFCGGGEGWGEGDYGEVGGVGGERWVERG